MSSRGSQRGKTRKGGEGQWPAGGKVLYCDGQPKAGVLVKRRQTVWIVVRAAILVAEASNG